MTIKFHRIVNFRNIRSASLEPSDGINLIYGRNGQGKTNLLESMYLTAAVRSFRKTKSKNMIREGEECAAIDTTVVCGDLDICLGIRLYQGHRKLMVDGKSVNSVKDFFGKWIPVVFTPEDHMLVKLGSDIKRPYFDIILSFSNPVYFNHLFELKRILLQKKGLLHRISASGVHDTSIDAWNKRLAQISVPIIDARAKLCERINGKLSHMYRSISRGSETVEINYRPGIDPLKPEEELKKIFREEISMCRCLKGPHRDRYEFLINKKSLKEFGSQGEQRTFLLALKMVQMEIAFEDTAKKPVLLIDDLGGELDPLRNKNFVSLIKDKGIQAFLTTANTNEARASGLNIDAVFEMDDGELIPKSGRAV